MQIKIKQKRCTRRKAYSVQGPHWLKPESNVTAVSERLQFVIPPVEKALHIPLVSVPPILTFELMLRDLSFGGNAEGMVSKELESRLSSTRLVKDARAEGTDPVNALDERSSVVSDCWRVVEPMTASRTELERAWNVTTLEM